MIGTCIAFVCIFSTRHYTIYYGWFLFSHILFFWMAPTQNVPLHVKKIQQKNEKNRRTFRGLLGFQISTGLNLACRYHILEIALEVIFGIVMGPSSGPDIGIFKSFQERWGCIDQSKPSTAMGKDDSEQTLTENRDELIRFALQQLAVNQPRGDYKELLELSIIFLGGVPPRGIRIRVPGAYHRARWMAKAVFDLMMLLRCS